MTKAGMAAAQEHGTNLPSFASQGEAEHSLFARRDELLLTLQKSASGNSTFRFDSSPDSLKALEKWYFDLLEGQNFGSLGLDQATFEHCISMYLGHVLVQNHPKFKWVVEKFAFQEGKYEIGVQRPLFSLMLTGRRNLAGKPNNKRRQSLWREYLGIAR